MDDLLKKLRALAEPTRLKVVTLLSHGELTVSEIMQVLGQSQPRVSRHLKMLTDAGLAERLPEGAWVFYRLERSGVSAKLAELINSVSQAEDPDLSRALERLEAVKSERAAAAAGYFEHVAKDWERIRALHFPEAQVEAAMRATVEDRRFKFHLDVGTGTGRMLEVFAAAAEDGMGVDFSHNMLNIARSNIAKAGLTDRFVRQGDATALPLDNQSADLITIHQVMHYLDEPSRALAECARVLKPGGMIVIADFAPHKLEFLREEHHHRRLGFHAEEVAGWLKNAGLEPKPITALAPGTEDGRLTVLIWTAVKIKADDGANSKNKTLNKDVSP
ncbi:ArsR/SmtB family transcription factor [Woodsholea maritima]|uniref:ArsR/SmtB family transcription factor n=1 Tax=Woodsholea maritima TaxID=240237 RepID=UPI00059535B4|nr:metalloregulator ArsR/SmtB family transcription factor [Woodsholea maritima]